MPALFRFEVHTPYHLFFSDMVEAVTLTLVDGEVGIYANHSAFTAPVVTGILRIKDNQGQWRAAFVTGGILEVKDHKTVLIADAAEWPEEIDRVRAEAAGREARKDIDSALFKFETDRAKEKLRRSQFRLKAAELGGNLSASRADSR